MTICLMNLKEGYQGILDRYPDDGYRTGNNGFIRSVRI